MARKIKNISITLYPFHREIVSSLAVARQMNFSAALREIVREWSEQKQQPKASDGSEA